MGRYIRLLEGNFPAHVDYLVMNFVDPLADAGSVALGVRMALTSLENEIPVARVNFDPLVDYRAQRPRAHVVNGTLEDIVHPTAALSLMQDISGKNFLYLYGAEPDFRWEELSADLLDVVDRFSVNTVFSISALPAGNPHTRQPDMIVRANGHPSDIPSLEAEAWFPSSFASFFEFIANDAGKATVNLAVRVPVYLVQHYYSTGAIAVLAQLSKMSGLAFPVGDLEHAAAEEAAQLDLMRGQNPEFDAMIESFESEYDSHEHDDLGLVRAPQTPLAVPSAEEIGDAAERFLASVEDDSRKKKEFGRIGEFNTLPAKVAHLRAESAIRMARHAREEDEAQRVIEAGGVDGVASGNAPQGAAPSENPTDPERRRGEGERRGRGRHAL